MANYVMYGFKRSSIHETAFLKKIPTSSSDDMKDILAEDIHQAKKFSDVPEPGKSGTPKQWLSYVNSEFLDLFGQDSYKFHLVKTLL